MLPCQTHQENILSILSTSSTPVYEALQARYFNLHTNHTVLWSTPFYVARQARYFKKHAKHANFLKYNKLAIS